MMSKTRSKIAVAVATQTALTRVIRGGLGSGVVGCAGADRSEPGGGGEVGLVVMHLPSPESIRLGNELIQTPLGVRPERTPHISIPAVNDAGRSGHEPAMRQPLRLR